ncbi:hypothetical protein niasHS_003093 [Heterodera schachtii]|uniref:Peptidase A2 domain-containing protein n=1 Tax=Heterodera schachtii TaxID=97005 RepID=A0ABD2KAB0_HETSC
MLQRVQSDTQLDHRSRATNNLFKGKVFVIGTLFGDLRRTVFLVDTGSPACLISANYLMHHRQAVLDGDITFSLSGVGHNSQMTIGRAPNALIEIGGFSFGADLDAAFDQSFHVLLGCDALDRNDANICFQSRKIRMRNGQYVSFLLWDEMRQFPWYSSLGLSGEYQDPYHGTVTWKQKGQGIAQSNFHEAVSNDLRRAFNDIEQTTSVRGIVLVSGKPKQNNFHETLSNDLRRAFGAIAQTPSVRGIVLVSGNPKFALPEVKLGLLPCADGTHLPRLISLQNALDMMLPVIIDL